MNRIARRSGMALLLVLVLMGGLIFFVGEYLLEAKDWINAAGSPHVNNGGNIGCGIILDRDGELLLDISEDRIYPESLSLRKSVIHWVGDREGNISAPALPNYSDALSGFDLINGIYSFAGTGGEAVLTLSARVQTVAMEALSGYKGTIAVYNYKTGEIMCAVSAPSYDPDDVPDILGDTTGEYEGAYLNRFTQVSYVPGSIFKVLTTAAAIESLPNAFDRVFTCEGSYFVDGNEVTCGRVHGQQSLSEAMTNSCNCVYAQIALELGADTLQEYVDQYELTDSIRFDGITTVEGYFDLNNATDPEIAWSAIGQHHDAVNPCRFMTFMGVIAGGGSAAEPYLVDRVTAGGSATYNAKASTTGRLMTPETAEILCEFMRNNVANSYGDENFSGLTVCAKSGTAEMGEGKATNAMFAGFCLDEEYPLAFFAAVEEGGYGRHTCVPIMSQVLEACKEVLDME